MRRRRRATGMRTIQREHLRVAATDREPVERAERESQRRDGRRTWNQVTAVSPRYVWIQDVVSSGLCEEPGDAERVANRAIRVEAQVAVDVVVGQHVAVTATVGDRAGIRELAGATIVAGAIDRLPPAHCERDGL